MNKEKHVPTEEDRLEEAEAHREFELSYWRMRVRELKASGHKIFSQCETLAGNERYFISSTNPFD